MNFLQADRRNLKTRQSFNAVLHLLTGLGLLLGTLATGCGKVPLSPQTVAGIYKEHDNESDKDDHIWEFTSDGKVSVWSIPKRGEPDLRGRFRIQDNAVVCRWDGYQHDVNLASDGGKLKFGKVSVLSRIDPKETVVAARTMPDASFQEMLAALSRTMQQQVADEVQTAKTASGLGPDSFEATRGIFSEKFITGLRRDLQLSEAQEIQLRLSASKAVHAGRISLTQLQVSEPTAQQKMVRQELTKLMDESYSAYRQALIKYAESNRGSLDTKASDGSTALMEAAVRGDAELINCLLKHGADSWLQDNSGRTALSYATQNRHDEAVKVLRAAGAK